jgi:carbon monoxide dehydrogenase subunit G
MQIQGTHVIRAPRTRVWQLLNDPAVLARITPGVSALTPTGDDRYAATFSVALGPVKGSFQATVNVTEKKADEAMSLELSARGPVGTIGAVGRLALADAPEGTMVTWSGEPRLMGMLASVGGRFAQTAARAHAETFFTKLEEEASR